MNCCRRPPLSWSCPLGLAGLSLVLASGMPVRAQVIIPGTGQEVADVGDDFEDPEWNWIPNLPKVYNSGDTPLNRNHPLGLSANDRWYEGNKRGQPDFIRRVPVPEGGLPGSTGALMLGSLHTGSTYPSRTQQQDDFIANVHEKIGRIPVSRAPSVVVRVWMPPREEWDTRTGCHFAFRIALEHDELRGRFRQVSTSDEDGIYWPGFFLNRDYRPDRGDQAPGKDSIYFWMKATPDSRQLNGPRVEQLGWWTLGLSVSPDGQVHYFARPGIEDLTADDHIASAFPFGHRAARFRTFFFNICNGDDGQTWSTPFIIDDPKVFIAR